MYAGWLAAGQGGAELAGSAAVKVARPIRVDQPRPPDRQLPVVTWRIGDGSACDGLLGGRDAGPHPERCRRATELGDELRPGYRETVAKVRRVVN